MATSGGLHAAADTQLGQDAPDVDGDRALADEQPIGDLAVGSALGQHEQHARTRAG